MNPKYYEEKLLSSDMDFLEDLSCSPRDIIYLWYNLIEKGKKTQPKLNSILVESSFFLMCKLFKEWIFFIFFKGKYIPFFNIRFSFFQKKFKHFFFKKKKNSSFVNHKKSVHKIKNYKTFLLLSGERNDCSNLLSMGEMDKINIAACWLSDNTCFRFHFSRLLFIYVITVLYFKLLFFSRLLFFRSIEDILFRKSCLDPYCHVHK